MTRNQFETITAWQDETFPASTPHSKLVHLADEIGELHADLKFNPSSAPLEFADCFILLFGAAHAAGMTYENIVDAIDEKMSINVKRAWGKPDANGVVNHIK